jgi:hypothetical protein
VSAHARAGQALLALFGLLCIVFSASVYAAEDPFPSDANALIATWGVGMGVLVIVLSTAGLRSGQRWPWLALWVLPVFFAAHVALLGTWIPDGVLLALSVVALAVTKPRPVADEASRAAAGRSNDVATDVTLSTGRAR